MLGIGDSSELSILVSMQNKASAEIAKLKMQLAGIGTEGSLLGSIFRGFGNMFSTELAIIRKAASLAAIGIATVAAAGVALAWQAAKTAGNLESWRQGFVNLLGSAEKADETIEMIKRDAAKTPFELPGLVQANLLLTQVTKEGPRSERMLLNVGKALSAAGKGQAELDRIIVNLQQIGNVGKITEMDIRQFGFAGINVLEMLADYYGTTKEKAAEMVKDSKDAFADLEGAFAKAGESGGKFENSFTLMSGTFNQLMSNLKDSFTILGAEVITQSGLFDIFKNAMAGATTWVNNNKDAIAAWVKDAVDVAKVKVQEWIEQMGGKEGIQAKLQSFWKTITNEVIPAVLWLVGVIKDIIGFVWEHREGIIKLIAIYEAVKVMLFLGGVIKAFYTFGTTIMGVTKAIGTAVGVGLAGALAVTLIAALAAVVAYITYKAIKEFEDLQTVIYNVQTTTIKTREKLNEFQSRIDSMDTGSARDQMQKLVDEGKKAADQADEIAERYKGLGGIINAVVDKYVDNFKEAIRWAGKFIDKLRDVISTGKKAGEYGGGGSHQHGGFIRGRAIGGHPQSGELSLVGEAGPELVRLPVGSKVIPNYRVGGLVANFYFNFAGAVISDKNDLINEIINAVNRKAELRELGATV